MNVRFSYSVSEPFLCLGTGVRVRDTIPGQAHPWQQTFPPGFAAGASEAEMKGLQARAGSGGRDVDPDPAAAAVSLPARPRGGTRLSS